MLIIRKFLSCKHYLIVLFSFFLFCFDPMKTPMIRSEVYDHFNMNEYPTGTNAVVAVISYTVCGPAKGKKSALILFFLSLFFHSIFFNSSFAYALFFFFHQGYDMEDAMIVNKSSRERGFANAHVITTKLIDLTDNKVIARAHEPQQPLANADL